MAVKIQTTREEKRQIANVGQKENICTICYRSATTKIENQKDNESLDFEKKTAKQRAILAHQSHNTLDKIKSATAKPTKEPVYSS